MRFCLRQGVTRAGLRQAAIIVLGNHWHRQQDFFFNEPRQIEFVFGADQGFAAVGDIVFEGLITNQHVIKGMSNLQRHRFKTALALGMQNGAHTTAQAVLPVLIHVSFKGVMHDVIARPRPLF